MIKISVIQHPNQTFPVILEGARYDLTIKDCDGFMIMDVIRDDVVILQGQRLLANTPIIPYNYLTQGNLVIITDNDDLPDWQQFGITQQLYYLTVEEWQTMIQE